MRVFITGGSGYIGNAVVAALRRAGHDVVALVRTADKRRTVEVHGARSQIGSLGSPDSYAEAARSAEAIVHAAADVSAGMAEVDRVATDALIEAAAAGGRRLVYTSGVWVHGDTGGKLVDEDAPLKPADLVAWRPAHEERALAAGRRGVAACVLRPGIVYGGKGGLIVGIMLNDPAFVRIVGSGENRWACVYLDDLADLYVRAVERAPGGQVFNATDGSRYKLREIAEAFGRAVGRDVGSWTLDEARKKLPGVADALAMSQEISSARAMALLGWRPRHLSIVAEADALVRAARAGTDAKRGSAVS